MGHLSPVPPAPPPRAGVVGPAGRPLLAALLALVLAAVALLGMLGASPASAQSASPTPSSSAGPGGSERGQSVRGTLRGEDRQPLVGVVVLVEQGGAEVARGETNERGQFNVPVPEAGTYTVRLDPASLPEGLVPRPESRDVNVRAGNPAPAPFAFGEGTRETASKFDRAPQLLVGGLQFGLVIAMAAIGLSLIFGTTGLTNFAHGELVTGGALLGYVFNVGLGLNLIPATLIAVVVGAAFGALLDRGLWRPLRRRGTGLIAALVVSIGLSLVLRYVYLYFYGGSQRSYAQYSTQDPLTFGPITILQRDLVIIAVALIVLIAIGLALSRTRIGKATRAVSDNPSLAASSGIDVERVINVVWAAGAGLAVLGGVFLALSQQVGYQLGQNVLLLLFAGVTLGGLGTAYGALVGSLVIGVFTQLSTLFIPAELQVVGALVVLILILIVRPQGILGRAERVG